jgi:hypothetical protein
MQYVLAHGEPEFRLKFDEGVIQVAEQISSCESEGELLALGATIKEAVARGMPERARIYLRFAFRERLGTLRMIASPPPLALDVAPVMCGDDDTGNHNTSMNNYYNPSASEGNENTYTVKCLVWEGSDDDDAVDGNSNNDTGDDDGHNNDDDENDDDDECASSPDSEFGPAITPSMCIASGLPLSPPSLSVSLAKYTVDL